MKEIEVIYHKASKKNAPIIFTTIHMMTLC